LRTAFFYGGRDIRVEDVPDPKPEPDEVIVRIRSAGVCGSDLHNYRGRRAPTLPIPWQQGHELAGEIVELGADVAGFRVGQRVGIEAEHLVGCGRCRWCRNGQYHICPDRGMRRGARHGSHGFSELDACAASNVKPLPDHVSFDAAALLDCYACGVHAVNRTPVEDGEPVAIIGTGAIAMTLGQVIRATSRAHVVMIGIRREPLEVALRSGAADEVVVGEADQAVDAMFALTGGEGAATTFETVGGTAQLLAQATRMTRRGGAISVLGLFTEPQTLDSGLGMARELTIRWSNSFGSWKGASEHGTALELAASGKLNPDPIITHHFSLEAIGEAFAAADGKAESGAIRVMVHPAG
jgi:2-desacetyl-2-hydroxyethyl bacteriochlorophyllide A dehydrogenase